MHRCSQHYRLSLMARGWVMPMRAVKMHPKPRVRPRVPSEYQTTLTSTVAPMSRNTSTNTITQSRLFLPGGPSKAPKSTYRSSVSPSRTVKSTQDETAPEYESQPGQSDGGSSINSYSTSESDSQNVKSQTFRRPSRFPAGKAPKSKSAGKEGEEDDDGTHFLPFSSLVQADHQDLTATLRNAQHRPSEPRSESFDVITRQQTSASSGSSASSGVATFGTGHARGSHRPPGPLSPRHRAELAKLSPHRQGAGKDGSDGSSMGSSFGELEDTSVTQSALEEALLSKLQHGGVASKMSTISQALKSRYL